MHIFTPSFFGGNGIVGAQVPVGAGVSFAQKYKGEKTCTFAMYGDGASNQGQVFEAFNMVRLPYFSTRFKNLMFALSCRLSSGTFPPSSCARTISTEWVLLPLVRLPTPNISRVATRFLVSRWVQLIYVFLLRILQFPPAYYDLHCSFLSGPIAIISLFFPLMILNPVLTIIF